MHMHMHMHMHMYMCMCSMHPDRPYVCVCIAAPVHMDHTHIQIRSIESNAHPDYGGGFRKCAACLGVRDGVGVTVGSVLING